MPTQRTDRTARVRGARWRRRLVAVAAGLALMAAGRAGAQASDATLVMPFDRVGDDSALYWLSEGAAILLADDLNALGAHALTRPERVDAFDLLGLPTSASLSRATIIKVGEVLDASDVVVGSVELQDNTLTVHARRLDIDVGRLRPDLVEQGPVGDLFQVFARLARRLVSPDAKVDDAPPLEREYPPIEAFESYVKGLVSETPATEARFLERAIYLHPKYDRARLALWEVRSEQGNHQAALEAVRGVPDDSPFARRGRFAAALSLLDLGRYDEAFAALEALDHQQQGAALLNDLGVVQLRRGGAAAATSEGTPTYFFTKAADAEPGAADYAFNAGYAYARARDMKAALYWLREVVRRDPADADAHYVLGVALEATGRRVEGAREKTLASQLAARYATEAASASDAVPPGLERVMRRLETPRAARLDAALVGGVQREQQDLATFHLERGRRDVEAGQDRAAIPELRRAIYLSPYLAEAHLLLGRVYLRAGRAREAIDAFKIAIWSQETADAHVALAEAYLQTDDVPAARREVARALALDPASADARTLRDEVNRRGGTGGGRVP